MEVNVHRPTQKPRLFSCLEVLGIVFVNDLIIWCFIGLFDHVIL